LLAHVTNVSDVIPADYRDLLERRLLGHLASTRPDGSPQVNPMWFVFDGTHLRFTHTTRRAKHRKSTADPRVAFSTHDPDQPYRNLEARGRVAEVMPDSEREFFVSLARRYGQELAARVDRRPASTDGPRRRDRDAGDQGD
jgi:PPOX class probable F420-dependent enzyme